MANLSAITFGIPTTGRVLGRGVRAASKGAAASGAGDTFSRVDADAAAYRAEREAMLQKQAEMQRQAERYTFLSNMLKMMHDTIMRIIGNIR